jgi:hypothetical protein
MTVLSMPLNVSKPRPVPWRRMLWVAWRQHRPTLISVPAVLGVVALYLLVAGLRIHDDWWALLVCHPTNSSACGTLSQSFTQTDWTMSNTTLILMQLAPALIGAFAGAPVLARELETGTFRYAWTQGAGRTRSTIARLVLLSVMVVVVAAAIGELFAWFFQPAMENTGMSDLSALVFATRPVAFAAWTLLAFMFGVFFGMLFRRILPAMAVTLGVYLALDLLAWLVLRAHYLPALVTKNPSVLGNTTSAGLTWLSSTTSPWTLSTWYTTHSGSPASMSVVNSLLNQYRTTQHAIPEGQYLTQHGITTWWSYIPVSRFWPMQFIEAGWLLVLSILLAAGTVWLVRRRAA